MSLVDLSTGGVLIEAPFQMRPGSRMTVEMMMSAERLDMSLRLLRCYIADLREGPRYRAACEFDHALQMSALVRQAARVEPTFLHVLEQFQHATLASEPALSETRFGELLEWAVNASRRNEPRGLIAARIETHLRQVFPTLVISSRSWLAPADPSRFLQSFDLEFRSEVPLSRSDRGFLRACAQLIGLLGGSTVSRIPADADSLGVSLEIRESDIAHTATEWIEMCRQNKTLA